MNGEIVSALVLGLLVGASAAYLLVWRFARKVEDMGLTLRAWSNYDGPNAQAHGRSSVTDLSTYRQSDR